VEHLDTL